MRPALLTVAETSAVTLLGVMAGFFFAFAIDVAPAMTRLDAAGYITTQQWINSVVRNAAFGAAYFGSAVLPFVASAVAWWAGQRQRALLWLVLAAVYFAAVFWLTRSVNVPINNEVALWNPAAAPAHWEALRDTWNQANLLRTVAALACFIASVALLATPRRAQAWHAAGQRTAA